MSRSCPSCGATSGYGPDEDGHQYCLTCDGPLYCGQCDKVVRQDFDSGADGFSCQGCGVVFHYECFPKSGDTDAILCSKCAAESNE